MLAGMGDEPRRAKALTFEIEGQPVRCIETDDGKRTWLCECVDFQERTTSCTSRWRPAASPSRAPHGKASSRRASSSSWP